MGLGKERREERSKRMRCENKKGPGTTSKVVGRKQVTAVFEEGRVINVLTVPTYSIVIPCHMP